MVQPLQLPPADRLSLPQVTLCAVTSVNVAATLKALEACLVQVRFADCVLLTDAQVQPPHPEIRIVPIRRLTSSDAYSAFLLSSLVDHVGSSHCLVAQWDGHIVNARRWRAEFLQYDYIGASWPQFADGQDVGNGGFSLRSRRLMELCRAPQFIPLHPEDLAIGRTNRARLEAQGIRFASREMADEFSTERTGDITRSFGYHGVFNMPRVVGVDAFGQIYDGLDDRGTVRHDFSGIVKDIWRQPRGRRLALRMLKDFLRPKPGAPRA